MKLESYVTSLEAACSKLTCETCKGHHAVRIKVIDRTIFCGFDDDACEEFKERMRLFVAMKLEPYLH